MSTPVRILIVEDTPDDAELLVLQLKGGGFAPVWQRVETAEEMGVALESGDWQAILSDYTLPAFSAMAALALAKEKAPDVPFLVVSGAVGEDVAVELMRAGACDFILKQNLARLVPAVTRELREAENRRERRMAVHAAEARFRAIIEKSFDAIVLTDADCIIQYASPAAEPILGQNPQELVGRNGWALVHPDDLARVQSLWDAIVHTAGGDMHSIHRVLRGGSAWRWVEVRCSNQLEDPTVRAVVVNFRDVTEQNEATERLRQSQRQAAENLALMETLLGNSPVGFAFINREFRYARVNGALAGFNGLRAADMIGRTVEEVVPEVWPQVKPIYDRLLAGGSASANHEVRTEMPGVPEPHRHFLASHYPVHSGGEIIGIGIVVHDVTERKRSEEALAQLAEIVRGSEDAIIGKSLDNTIVSWNLGAERLYGYRADEVLGRPVALLLPPERREECGRVLMALKGGERVAPFESVRLRKDGTRFDASVTISPVLDAERRLVGASAIERDITQRKQAEQELAESHHRFEETLDAVSDLFVAFDGAWNYTYLNRKAAAFTGHQPAELIGRNIWQVFPDAVGGLFHRELEAAAATGTTRRFEAFYQTLGRWFEHRAYPHPRGLSLFSTDITERKRSEALIARDAALLANVRDSVMVTDLDGVVSYWNEGATRIYGWTAEEMLGRPMTDRVPGERRAAVAATIADVRQGREFSGEWQDFRKDGSRIWVDARVTLIRDREGQPTGIMGIAHDIGARKEAEAVLREKEVKLAAAIHIARIGYWSRDLVTGVVDWSDELYEMFGMDRTPAGQTFEGFLATIHPDDRERVRAAATQAQMSPGSFESTYRIVVGGEIRVIHDVGRVFATDEDNILRMVGTAQDITEQARAVETLRLRDRAIQAVTAGVIITDPNQPDNPIIYASPGFERLTGYRQEEVLGKNCRFLQGKGTAAESVAQIRAAIRDARPCEVELLNYRKEGTPFWNALSLSPVRDENGRLSHFVGVQTDVTERRSLEEQFRQAQKMEAIGRLAGGVAHDFNNLLTIINGYGDILLSRLPSTDPARELLREICNAGDRAARLTRQLLAFSRKTVLTPKILDVNAQVEEMEKLLHRLIGEDIQLVTSLAPNLGLVNVDPGQLEQAVINLCVNARDAMPHGGKITIETHNVELNETYSREHSDLAPGKYVMLSVTDSGQGMDAATRARIFEPFFTTKEPGKGTGLGLAMVYGFVKQSMGHVTVESEPGHGAAFKLYLPCPVEPPHAPKPASGVRPMPRGNETILLVEDETAVRVLTRHILHSCGYHVLEAEDGHAALRIAEQHQGPLHMLVTDVVMPQLSGRQVAEKVLALHPGAKVLYLSGYTDDAVVRHGILQADANFLQKPFSPAILSLKVREILDRAPAVSADA